MIIDGVMNKILREGIIFKNMSKFLEKSSAFSEQELKNYQDERLKNIIVYAYQNVPYYKEVFDTNKLKIMDIKTQQDLWKIPILTKNDIKKNFKKLKSVKLPRIFLNEGHTSGTTGTPAHFLRDLKSINFENAIVWRQWNWAKFYMGDKMVVCRGNKVKTNEVKKIFWEKNKIEHKLMLSSFNLSEDNMKYYIDAIREYGGVGLQAYPSTAYIIAKYLKKVDEKIKFKAVFTSSEPIYEYQRNLIEERFQCKIWDFYGMGERVISASECNLHNGLHINEEYGIAELLDDNNEPSTEGYLVGTTLHNYAMPLIRYMTNDYTRLQSESCRCGRKHRVIKPIETKKEDMIITKDGRYISPSIITHAFKSLTYIAESQIIQNDFDDFDVNIVPESGFANEEKRILLKGLKERLGEDSNIMINLVRDIPRTSNGKFRWIISNIEKRKI